MFIAKANQIPTSRRKVKPVVALIRGRSVEEALVILEHTPRRSAQKVAKLLKDAKNQALAKNYYLDSLVVEQIYATNGQRQRRYIKGVRRFGAGGFRPRVIERQSCHLRAHINGRLAPQKKVASTKTEQNSTKNKPLSAGLVKDSKTKVTAKTKALKERGR